MLALTSNPIIFYVLGILSTIIIYVSWCRLCVIIASRSTLCDAKELEDEPIDPLEQQANRHIKACKQRLLLQAKVNPDWVKPLKDELPQLVQEISTTFYPQEENSLLAPGVSEFIRAIELTANDIATFLQNNRCGRLLDISTNKAHKTVKVTKRVIGSNGFKQTSKWYKRIRPVIQTIKYKSPVMWTIVMGRNLAVRTLHVKITDIVGRRSIQLYSGSLASQ